MRQIVLLDPNPTHAKRIADALTAIACRTLRCADVESAAKMLAAAQADLMAVVPGPSEDWRVVVARLREAMHRAGVAEHGPIICLLPRPYRGPEERVFAARRGVRIIYER